MANEVLELLLHADGFLSGQAISNQLGVSRAAVWKKVKALQEAGYEIDSVTNRGYRLRACPDVLTQEQLRAALGPHPWADQIVLRETVDSTNNLAKQLGADGAPSWLWPTSRPAVVDGWGAASAPKLGRVCIFHCCCGRMQRPTGLPP